MYFKSVSYEDEEPEIQANFNTKVSDEKQITLHDAFTVGNNCLVQGREIQGPLNFKANTDLSSSSSSS